MIFCQAFDFGRRVCCCACLVWACLCSRCSAFVLYALCALCSLLSLFCATCVSFRCAFCFLSDLFALFALSLLFLLFLLTCLGVWGVLFSYKLDDLPTEGYIGSPFRSPFLPCTSPFAACYVSPTPFRLEAMFLVSAASNKVE